MEKQIEVGDLYGALKRGELDESEFIFAVNRVYGTSFRFRTVQEIKDVHGISD
jgi:hypothetical protein